jgi:hypothetical protein
MEASHFRHRDHPPLLRRVNGARHWAIHLLRGPLGSGVRRHVEKDNTSSRMSEDHKHEEHVVGHSRCDKTMGCGKSESVLVQGEDVRAKSQEF